MQSAYDQDQALKEADFIYVKIGPPIIIMGRFKNRRRDDNFRKITINRSAKLMNGSFVGM